MNRLLLTAALCCIFAASCKKNSDNPTPHTPAADTTTRPAWAPGSARSFTNACGLALSPLTGEVAISAYNGGYGTYANVYVYRSMAALFSGAPPIAAYTNAKAPEALVFDANGNLYIAETEATAGVTILRKNGDNYTWLKTIQNGFNNPRGMAFDAQGRLYLCDDGNSRVLRFDAPLSSDNYTVIIQNLSSPKAIAISGSDVYIAEYDADRVSKWKLDSYTSAVATATVTAPVDVAANGSFVAVGSPATKCVQLFHSKMMSASAGSYSIASQPFGMILDPQGASLTVAAYDLDKIIQYK